MNNKELNALSLVARELEDNSSYNIFSTFHEIFGLDFIIYCHAHLARRAIERGYSDVQNGILNSFINLFKNENVFDAVTEAHTCFLYDEVEEYGFFLELSNQIKDGVIVNKIYVKTYFSLQNCKEGSIYVDSDDDIIVYNRYTDTVTEDSPFVCFFNK